MKLSVVLLGLATALPQIQNEQASQFLARQKRASNKGHFEEMKKGNLERECIEETCNDQELYEVYDDASHPGIQKYNDCKELVHKAIVFSEDYGIEVAEGKQKMWLRTCVTKTQEEIQREIREALGRKWQQFVGQLGNKLDNFFDQFS